MKCCRCKTELIYEGSSKCLFTLLHFWYCKTCNITRTTTVREMKGGEK